MLTYGIYVFTQSIIKKMLRVNNDIKWRIHSKSIHKKYKKNRPSFLLI